MLKVDQLNADEYLRYVAMGPSSVSNKSERDEGTPSCVGLLSVVMDD